MCFALKSTLLFVKENAVLIGVIVAFLQFRKHNHIAQGELIRKYTEEFYVNNEELLKTLNRGEALYDETKKDSSWEIDNLIGHIEDLYLFWKRGLITFEQIDRQFGYYIYYLSEDTSIIKYRTEVLENDFDGFSYLATRCSYF
jgi:hypothetical protein